jgi:predicted nucleic-acid-binding protein
MIYFIDSDIFLRVLIKEKKFEECYKILDLVRKNKIKAITSSLVLAEIDWVLEGFYKFEKMEVIEGLKSILKLRGLKIFDKINPSLAIELYQSYNIKFIDALIASNPKIFKKEIAIISYDKDFDKIGVIRKEPKDLIKK